MTVHIIVEGHAVNVIIIIMIMRIIIMVDINFKLSLVVFVFPIVAECTQNKYENHVYGVHRLIQANA